MMQRATHRVRSRASGAGRHGRFTGRRSAVVVAAVAVGLLAPSLAGRAGAATVTGPDTPAGVEIVAGGTHLAGHPDRAAVVRGARTALANSDGCAFSDPALVITDATGGEICFAQPATVLTGVGDGDLAQSIWPVIYGSEAFGADAGARVWFHENENNTGWADCYAGGPIAAFSIVGQDQRPGNIQLTDNFAPC